jgi:hypothetical protein
MFHEADEIKDEETLSSFPITHLSEVGQGRLGMVENPVSESNAFGILGSRYFYNENAGGNISKFTSSNYQNRILIEQ